MDPDAELAAQRVLADRDRFDLDAVAAEAWDAMSARPARDLPGLRRLTERPSPFVSRTAATDTERPAVPLLTP